jgi:hypothetical protein
MIDIADCYGFEPFWTPGYGISVGRPVTGRQQPALITLDGRDGVDAGVLAG